MEAFTQRLGMILPQLKTHKLEAGLLSMSLATCLVGSGLLVFSLTAPALKPEKDYSKAPKVETAPSVNPTEDNSGRIIAEISGAVSRPGVYRLPAGSRIDDLIEKANGLSEQANSIYVAKSINRAETLTDQQKLYIPSLGEEAPVLSSNPPSTAEVQNKADSPSESPFLSINAASKTELEDLPGIGEITADKIIEGRPYTSIEELSKNGILKKNVFEGIREKISL